MKHNDLVLDISLNELDSDECREINGGLFGIDDIIIGIVVGAAIEVMSDWDNFKAGLSGHPPVKK
ncbi:MAG: hypothetical protein KF763_17835 [Cyclobacteriaceae bacterium]|nr:hypothetical protein [Cyclobacteriaceae bacterium]